MFEDKGTVVLDCNAWKQKGDGWLYKGRGGSVSKVVFKPNKVLVKGGAPGFAAVVGPVAYVEAWLEVDGARHLLRYHAFKKNEAAKVVTAKPSAAGAAGEIAFWETLWGVADRADDRDGRSQISSSATPATTAIGSRGGRFAVVRLAAPLLGWRGPRARPSAQERNPEIYGRLRR